MEKLASDICGMGKKSSWREGRLHLTLNWKIRQPLPDSAFADRIGRRFPIYDISHARAALFWMEQDIARFMKEPYCEEIHNRIVRAGKKFGIPHRKCPLCKGLPEKVVFT